MLADKLLGYLMIYFAIGLTVSVDGAFFAQVVMLYPATTRTYKLEAILAFLRYNLLSAQFYTGKS